MKLNNMANGYHLDSAIVIPANKKLNLLPVSKSLAQALCHYFHWLFSKPLEKEIFILIFKLGIEQFCGNLAPRKIIN